MRKIILTLGLLLVTIFTFGQETKYVNTEVLNVRSGASTDNEIIDKINKGEKVIVLSNSYRWSKVELENGNTGYVSSKFLSDNSSDGYPWYIYLIVIVLALYLINKVLKFFGGSSNSNNSTTKSPSRKSSDVRSAPQPQQKYYCKCCGADFKNIKDLTFNSCFKNSTKKHELFEGEVENKYYCKDCGQDFKNLKDLTFNSCFKSPTKKHRPYEGSNKSRYTCKHCGQDFKNLKDLTFNSCFKSPSKKHQPAR